MYPKESGKTPNAVRELVVSLTFSLSMQNINLLSPSLEVSVSEFVPVCLLGGVRAPSHQCHSCPTIALQLCRRLGAQLGWEAWGVLQPSLGLSHQGSARSLLYARVEAWL